jgi:transposase-like protein
MEINLINLIERYGDDKKCRAYLEVLKWPEKVWCPRCSSDKISKIYGRDQFDCDNCRYQFSVTAGCIFDGTHLPIWKWFLAVYLILESKKAVSANQLKRSLAISYKTAWYLCHRIRRAVLEATQSKLRGVVEIDETYIGGKKRHVGSGNLDNKTMVLGAVQRGGAIRLKVQRRKKANRKVLHAFIRDTTHPKTECLMTDENPAYLGIADQDTSHETVNHHAEEWARGDVHTNSIEGVWSLFKRGIVGSYHQISAKHLQAYIDEFEWRFNGRDNPELFRDTMLRLLNTPKMEFRELIEKNA